MNRQILFIILIIIPFLVYSQDTESNRGSLKDRIDYFPPDTAGIDSFKVNWCSKYLSALNEPVLYNMNNTEVYRFTWLRTFHHPISIRIQKKDNKYVLILKVTNGAGGYEPGILIKNEEKEITESDWNQFKNMLKEINFYGLATNEKNYGFDGAEWILEAKLPDKFKVTIRWSPEKNRYADCCLFLVNISGLKIKKSEIY